MFCPIDGNELRAVDVPSALGTSQHQSCEACGRLWLVRLQESARNPEKEIVIVTEEDQT